MNSVASVGSASYLAGAPTSSPRSTIAQSQTAQPVDVVEIHSASTRASLQLGRIAAGVADNELTTDQAQSLVSEEQALHQEVKSDVQSGGFSATERSQIVQQRDAISAQIFGEKHPQQPTEPLQPVNV
jgi:hypothetical protein